ncbi:MAG: DNA alkylation repair protein [Actinobacteria bacterium]|nr:DNA alkylation repair protein [Actinomycetota bacterium]
MPRSEEIIRELKVLGDPERAEHSRRYFKTGVGEYGEGDIFLGIRVPEVRKCARRFWDTGLEDALELLKSPYHEARLLSLFMLVARYSKAGDAEKEAIYQAYLDNTRYVNNWDLVDSSASYIVGDFLLKRDRKILYRLALSKSLWERRISIISTSCFIRDDDFSDTLAISELLLHDREDLIHKAAGWMLREVGNRDMAVEEAFLARHYREMPRTMLRYAIEKFPEEKRQAYLKGSI